MNYLEEIKKAENNSNQKRVLSISKLWITNESSNEQAWYCYGTVLFQLGKYKEAIETLAKAVELKPNYDKALSNIGSAYCSLGEYKIGLPYFERAYESARDEEVKAAVLPCLVDCHICCKEFKQATAYLPELSSIDEEMALMLEGKIMRAIIPGERSSFWQRFKWW